MTFPSVLSPPVCAAVALIAFSSASGASTITGITYLGADSFATGTMYGGTEVGGLSGMAHVAGAGFKAVSDDKGDRPDGVPPRVYDIDIDLSGDGLLTSGDVTVTGVTTMTQPGGAPLAAGSIDPEGIAIAGSGEIYIADEGFASSLQPPAVRSFDAGLEQQGTLPLPSKFAPSAGNGVANNRGFESLTTTPDGTTLVTAAEEALVQDGPLATGSNGSSARILTYDLLGGVAGAEYVYEVDPVPISGAAEQNGLVELVALPTLGRFLALERSFSLVAGILPIFGARLYEIDVAGATDVSVFDTLPGLYAPVSKELILDLGTLGIGLDNLEGMAFGDVIDTGIGAGMHSLFLVSDNNFQPTFQSTQFLAFGVDLATTPVPGPATGGLLLGAMAVLGAARRRRR